MQTVKRAYGLGYHAALLRMCVHSYVHNIHVRDMGRYDADGPRRKGPLLRRGMWGATMRMARVERAHCYERAVLVCATNKYRVYHSAQLRAVEEQEGSYMHMCMYTCCMYTYT